MNNTYSWKEFRHFILNKKFNLLGFSIATIFSIVDSLLSVFISIKIKSLIDNYTNIDLELSVYFIMIVLLIKVILDLISTYLLNAIGLNVIKYIRDRASTTLVNMKHSVISQEQSGELAGHVINDTLAMFDFISRDISGGIVAIISTVVYIVFLLYLDISLTFLILGIVIVLFLIYAVMGVFLSQITFKNQKLTAQFTHRLTDTIKKHILIQVQNFQKGTISLLWSLTTAIKDNSYKKLFVSTMGKLIISLITMIGGVILIFYAQYQLNISKISFGVLSAYLLISIQLVPAVIESGGFLATIRQAKGATTRLFEITNLPIESVDDGKKIDDIIKIEFKNVTFKYQNTTIINDLSFIIKSGDIVSIDGPNGSGKTTILMLLMGFLIPNHGGIYINDIDLKDISKSSLRSQISYANQRPLLVEGSISLNMTLGSNKKNNLDVGNLIEKYDINQEKLIEDGNNLSGGQQQKIGLARLELQNRSTIILDETFSNLDVSSKKDLVKLIKTTNLNGITIIVDHDNTVTNLINKRIKLEK